MYIPILFCLVIAAFSNKDTTLGLDGKLDKISESIAGIISDPFHKFRNAVVNYIQLNNTRENNNDDESDIPTSCIVCTWAKAACVVCVGAPFAVVSVFSILGVLSAINILSIAVFILLCTYCIVLCCTVYLRRTRRNAS